MRISQKVKRILDNYESDNPGTKANLARILMHGKLGGTGRMIILPVDQGFEHGPARSFAPNPDAYDPHYHFQLAVDAGKLSGGLPDAEDFPAAEGVATAELRKKLSLNAEQVVLAGADRPAAIAWGWEAGIRLFQGRLIESQRPAS